MAKKLRGRTFIDPETGVLVRFRLWDEIETPPAGSAEIFCVLPEFEWPHPDPRALTTTEYASFLLGCELTPDLLGNRFYLERQMASWFFYVLGAPAALSRNLSTELRELGQQKGTSETFASIMTRVRAEVKAGFDTWNSPSGWTHEKTEPLWFEMGGIVATLVHLSCWDSEDKEVRLFQLVSRLRELLGCVPMTAVDRAVFREFLKLVRRPMTMLEPINELEGISEHFRRQFAVVADRRTLVNKRVESRMHDIGLRLAIQHHEIALTMRGRLGEALWGQVVISGCICWAFGSEFLALRRLSPPWLALLALFILAGASFSTRIWLLLSVLTAHLRTPTRAKGTNLRLTVILIKIAAVITNPLLVLLALSLMP